MSSDQAELAIDFDEHGLAGEHMKAMWAGQSNVLVATRVRPIMKHDANKKSCVRVLDGNVVVILDPASGDKQDILRAKRSREKHYAFDSVFDGSASQDSIYKTTTKFLIHGVLDGYNATVFAYGQTGSGKTYTMIGTQQDPGIMVKVMGDLFVHSKFLGKQQGVNFKVSVSFLEVYNENIRDLLSDTEEYLDLREDPIKGPCVAGITEVETTSSEEIMTLLHQGNAKRSQAATAANEVSSRSHAVLQIGVECQDRAPGVVANMKVGKLSLVDLAGSERAANTKNSGQRLVEGANINRSLLALGNCINALGEKGGKGNFVPYRDSKLTRLLKDSLGGNCRTVMIANISSTEASFEETLNTLKYANRAKNIKTHAQRNVLNVNYHISEYVQLINNLRGEIKLLKDQIAQDQRNDPVPYSLSEPVPPSPHGRLILPSPSSRNAMRQPNTPLQILRESLRSAVSVGAEGRELLSQMRQKIVDNFQERMQLRRSLIELEDQNVQNSIEVSKRQLIVVQWTEHHCHEEGDEADIHSISKERFINEMQTAPNNIREAWHECEQIRKAISKNNLMKKNISKRLRNNEKEAEKFRDELDTNITGEDRKELMELQYQVGRLELENMELEQHRIVHESIVKGKDLVIQKLKLQLAVKDKYIQQQRKILEEHNLQHLVGFNPIVLMEQTVMGDVELNNTVAPPSPPRDVAHLRTKKQSSGTRGIAAGGEGGPVARLNIPPMGLPAADEEEVKSSRSVNDADDSKPGKMNQFRDGSLTDRDHESGEGEWDEVKSEFSDASFDSDSPDDGIRRVPVNKKKKKRTTSKPQPSGGGNAGVRAGGNFNNNNNGNIAGNNNGVAVAPSFGLEGQGYQKSSRAPAPRGGRQYRNSVASGNEMVVLGAGNDKQPLKPNGGRKYQSYPDYPAPASEVPGLLDESLGSDDDNESFSVRGYQPQSIQNGNKALGNKPSVEKFDPYKGGLRLPSKVRNVEIPVLSPRRAGAGFGKGGNALIFPANDNKKDAVKDREQFQRAVEKHSRGGAAILANRGKTDGRGYGSDNNNDYNSEHSSADEASPAVPKQQNRMKKPPPILTAINERGDLFDDAEAAVPTGAEAVEVDVVFTDADESDRSDAEGGGRSGKSKHKAPNQIKPLNLLVAGQAAGGGGGGGGGMLSQASDDSLGVNKRNSSKNVVLGKLKGRINALAMGSAAANAAGGGGGGGGGVIGGLDGVSGIGGVAKPLQRLKPSILRPTAKVGLKQPSIQQAASVTSTSDGGVPSSSLVPVGGVGAVQPIVPQIGGRNRSLPNLPKQQSGPNSARSQKGND